MLEHRVSRKFYSLLLNRAFGDLLACMAHNVAVLYSMWFEYERYITMKRCKQFCVFSWILFFMSIVHTIIGLIVTTVPSVQKYTECTTESCLYPLYLYRHILVIAVYLFTLLCFAFTVVLIQRAKKHSESFHQSNKANHDAVQRRFKYPMIKLALHILTFSVFDFPYFLVALVLVIKDKCFYHRHYNFLFMLCSWVEMSLLTRIIIDSVLSLCLETQVKQSFLRILKCATGVIPSIPTPKDIIPTKNSGKGSVTVSATTVCSNAENALPLTAQVQKQQRLVREWEFFHKTHTRTPGDVRTTK
ncbi:unnamed protein product [Bursaphelenchus okinawaensis]|uniref:G_PROTEIN_RECEP_F1_2 domain-containing protein n=1 Tax=Bursaphelenchus okinawaensis TaxID=465554 RepID=A0A811L3E1_9BILA|nr:unnamed protein product [Bursaphelenchus okinawaensis]CAG9115280.1 unnamed protein product [Bursaphelenchus okinawaensis]